MVKVAFVMGDYPKLERARRERVALSYSNREIEVGIVSAPALGYKTAKTPADIELGNPAFIAAFREAERLGYDAAVPLGTVDFGVDGGRSAVDIPVVGPAEAMLYLAGMMGHRFGLLTYDSASVALVWRAVHRAGMTNRISSCLAVNIGLTDFASDEKALKAATIRQAKALVADGADVVLVMGISLCPVFISAGELSEEAGVPVLEGIGAPIHLAGLFAALGLRHSRLYWPKAAS